MPGPLSLSSTMTLCSAGGSSTQDNEATSPPPVLILPTEVRAGNGSPGTVPGVLCSLEESCKGPNGEPSGGWDHEAPWKGLGAQGFRGVSGLWGVEQGMED